MTNWVDAKIAERHVARIRALEAELAAGVAWSDRKIAEEAAFAEAAEARLAEAERHVEAHHANGHLLGSWNGIRYDCDPAGRDSGDGGPNGPPAERGPKEQPLAAANPGGKLCPCGYGAPHRPGTFAHVVEKRAGRCSAETQECGT